MRKLLLLVLIILIGLGCSLTEDRNLPEKVGPLIILKQEDSLKYWEYTYRGEEYDTVAILDVSIKNPTNKNHSIIFYCRAFDKNDKLIGFHKVDFVSGKTIKIPIIIMANSTMDGKVKFHFKKGTYNNACKYEYSIEVKPFERSRDLGKKLII